jgi:hypothetical protein
VVKGAKEVDAFDVSTLTTIIVPADELAFVGVGLLLDSVVDNEYAK